MTITQKKQRNIELRKRLSIELCDNFTKRLNPAQKYETKLGAVIAIRNFIKNSKFDDPILLSFLVDTIADPDENLRSMVYKVIKEVVNPEIIELLEIKLQEVTSNKLKQEITELLKVVKK